MDNTHTTAADPLQQAGVTIYQGDTCTVLRQLAAHGTQVHAIITSPPYANGARDYNLPPSVWGGDPQCNHRWETIQRYNDSPARRGGEGVGFDDADRTRQQRWSDSARCVTCGAWQGTLGAEPQIDCRRAWLPDRCGLCYVCHLLDVLRLCRAVLRPDGVLWLNLGDTFAASRSSRVADGHGQRVPDGYKPKDCVMVAALVALAAQADGWWLRAPLIPWIKPNPLPGPWTDRPVVGHEWWIMLTSSERYWYDHVAVRQPFTEDSIRRSGTRARQRSWGESGRDSSLGYPIDAVPLHNGGRNYRTTDPWYGERRSLAQTLRGLADRLLWHQRDDGLLTDEDGMPLAIACGVGGAAGQGVHFASFPARVVRPFLRASVPPLCCPVCGTGWTRTPDGASWHAACACGTAGQADEQQRQEAAILRQSPHRATMERDAGPAFAHYLRTDDPTGARAIPPDLRARWQERGWLESVAVPPDSAPPAPEPGIVLDPFAGVMTTLAVALDEDRHAIGIELNPAYVTAGRQRLAAVLAQRQPRGDARPRRAVTDAPAADSPHPPPPWTWRAPTAPHKEDTHDHA